MKQKSIKILISFFLEGCSSIGDINEEWSLLWLINKSLDVLRGVVPVAIIVLGSIDLFKAVIANSDDKMVAAQKTLIKRIIAALCIFLIPTLVKLLISNVMDVNTCGI